MDMTEVMVLRHIVCHPGSITMASFTDNRPDSQSDVELGLPSRTSTASIDTAASGPDAGDGPSIHTSFDERARDGVADGETPINGDGGVENGVLKRSNEAAGNRSYGTASSCGSGPDADAGA